MFVYANSTDDFADELLPINQHDNTGSIEPSISEHHKRNFKREALLVNILMDIMDKFYVSKKIVSKRSQYEEVIVRDKNAE